jgi:glycosyltransferase involved in cell wall biosynthesis
MNPEVTIGFVSFNTWNLTKLCLDSISKFTATPHNLIIADNGSTDGSREELKQIEETGRLMLLELEQDKNEFGSIGHARALDIIMEFVTTRYTLIFDSDCIALKHDWIKDLLKEFDNNTKAIGAKPFRYYDNIGMIHANCLFFETQLYHNLGLTFMPDPEKNIDTGGCISLGLVKAGYSLKYVDWLNIDDAFPGRYFYGVRCAEYVLDNRPVWAHFGRGTSKRKSQCDYNIELEKWVINAKKMIHE